MPDVNPQRRAFQFADLLQELGMAEQNAQVLGQP